MSKIERVYGLDITYHSNVSVSGAEKVNSVEELKAIALKKIEEQRDIKNIRLYMVEWKDDSHWGKTTNLETIEGYNEYRNPFDDPSFRKYYNELLREQD